MHTIDTALQWAKKNLIQEDKNLAAEILLAHVLQVSRSYLKAYPEKEIIDTAWTDFQTLLKRRQHGEPIAYLIGTREFWSLPLQVTNATLIPRPETELLVMQTLRQVTTLKKPIKIMDMGTGTGAIALALATECTESEIIACDISPAALQVAQQNANLLKIKNITWIESNWFNAIPPQPFHIIVSNPPYIAEGDIHLKQGDIAHEPRIALVAGIDGLAALRILITNAPLYLQTDGWLLLEHGYQQADAVQKLLQVAGFQQIETIEDIAGNPRVTQGQWCGEKNIQN